MKRWARQLRRRYPEVPALALVAAVADRAAAGLGVAPVVPTGLDRPDLAAVPEPPGGWADPWLLGLVHELVAPATERRSRGAWYTPRPVVEGLVRLALATTRDVDVDVDVAAGAGAGGIGGRGGAPVPAGPALVVDPTCGGGAFLLAALDQLVAAGDSPTGALGRVAGLDLDPDAVEVTRWALTLWWAARRSPGDPESPPPVSVRVGDALVDQAVAEAEPAGRSSRRARAIGRGPVLVVGNPPFASPLRQGVMPASAAGFRAERAEVLGPYADLAAIHLLRAVETAPAGSTVALVVPQSVLSGRDTEGLRAHLEAVAPLRALWAVREPVFDAAVRACAVVLAVGAAPAAPGGEVLLADGPTVRVHRRHRQPAASPVGVSSVGVSPVGGPRSGETSGAGVSGRVGERSWGALGADALGAPPLPVVSDRHLGELVTATAGFRDEYYALVAACREAEPGEEPDGRRSARLVTVGAVEPLWTAWGTAPTRFGGLDRDRPVVDPTAATGRVEGWLARQLRPKVVLATQTRLLEPYVDRVGVVAPATPLIAVHADPADLDRVAAVLLAPPVVVWAWRRWFGTAMAIEAVKLAARQVAELPLPVDEGLWAEAAALVAGADGCDRAGARAVAVAVARLMTAAYGASDEVFAWWEARLAPAAGGVGGNVEAGSGPVR